MNFLSQLGATLVPQASAELQSAETQATNAFYVIAGEGALIVILLLGIFVLSLKRR